jgi:hypothetical protein
MSTKISLSAILLMMAILTNCKQSNTNQIPKNQEDSIALEEKLWKEAPLAEPEAPLETRLTNLDTKVKNAWINLEELDKEKFVAVEKLVVEFGTLKGVQKPILDSVKTLAKQAVELRYNENNLNNITVLDKYDATVELLMNKINRLQTTTSTKDLEKCILCGRFLEQIRQAESEDFNARLRYTSAAQDLNTLLEKEKRAIKKLGEKFQEIKKVNIFAN